MSIEPPMIRLGKRVRPDWPENIRQYAEEAGLSLPAETGVVLSTRDRAREILAAHPSVTSASAVYLNARDVEIATPSFFDQLLTFWPKAQLIGANDDVRESFELAAARRQSKEGQDG